MPASSASLTAKTLFLASARDEFEMLDFNRDWVHVRISGLSRGWIWRNNLEMPDSVPDSLKEQLELWRYRAPGDQDFTSNSEMFPAASYQYVLFGMGFRMDVRHQPLERGLANAQRAFTQNKTLKAKWTQALPKNRDLINKIKSHGLQKI